MTIPLTELTSPAEEFLRRTDPTSPAEEFLRGADDPFTTPASPFDKQDDTDLNWKVFLSLAAGFLVARVVAQRWAEQRDTADVAAVYVLLDEMPDVLAVEYERQLGPALRVVYAEAPTPDDLAGEHARGLGRMLADTTVRALTEGFTAGLNSGMQPQVAWARALAGLGLDSQQMRQWLPKAAGDGYTPSLVSRAGQKLLRKLLLKRADKVADNELFVARNLARQVRWRYWKAIGKIPKDTMKQWVTAADERVCPICRPLHLQTKPVDEPFIVNDQRIWNPGMHPNCRCVIRLLVPRDLRKQLSKAATTREGEWDPYDRGPGGKFAPQEARGARPVKPADRPMRISDFAPPQEQAAEPPQQAGYAPLERESTGGESTGYRPLGGERSTPSWTTLGAQPAQAPQQDTPPAAYTPLGPPKDTPTSYTPLGPAQDTPPSYTPLGPATGPAGPDVSRLHWSLQPQTPVTIQAEPPRYHREMRVANGDALLVVDSLQGDAYPWPGDDDIPGGAPYRVADSTGDNLIGRVVDMSRLPHGAVRLSAGDESVVMQEVNSGRAQKVSEELAHLATMAGGRRAAYLREQVTTMASQYPKRLGQLTLQAIDTVTDRLVTEGMRIKQGDITPHGLDLETIASHLRDLNDLKSSFSYEKTAGGPELEAAMWAEEISDYGSGTDLERLVQDALIQHMHESGPAGESGFPDLDDYIYTRDLQDYQLRAAEDALREMRRPVLLRFEGWVGDPNPANPAEGRATGYYRITDARMTNMLATPEYMPNLSAEEQAGSPYDLTVRAAEAVEGALVITLRPITEDEFNSGVELGTTFDEAPLPDDRLDPGQVRRIIHGLLKDREEGEQA